MNTETVEPTTDTATTIATNGAMVHLARCTECGICVQLGIGTNGRPVCPNGHGEMELADDRLPIEQAMEQVAEKLTEPQRLPYPSPPFNYEGALHEIFEMEQRKRHPRIEVQRRRRAPEESEGRARRWPQQLSALIGTLQREHCTDRQAGSGESGGPSGGDEPRALRVGTGAPGRDVPNVFRRRAVRSATQSMSISRAVGVFAVHRRDRRADGLSPGLFFRPTSVNAMERRRSHGREGVGRDADRSIRRRSARPAILGTAHVAADFTTSEAVPGDTYQSCVECGARLLTYKTGDDEGASFEPYPAGTLVGTDCEGAKEPARYAKRGKRAKAAK
jgi:ferredoxin-like protein FixX